MSVQASLNKRTKIKFNLNLSSIKWLTVLYIYLITFLYYKNFINAENSTSCRLNWIDGKKTAECAGRSFSNVPYILKNNIVHVIRLENNNLQILPDRIFQEKGLIDLQKIFLFNCSLGIIKSEAFYKLINLIELDLSKNLLTEVPSHSFHNLANVRRLLLRNNEISIIKTGSFVLLTKLEYLDLGHCKISVIEPNAFQSLPNLRRLKLDSNNITTLGLNVLSDILSLYTINLENNPWVCDCNLRDLRTWISNTNVNLNEPPFCKSPSRTQDKAWSFISLDELACAPKILPSETEVSARLNSNSTFSCRVKSIPKSEIDWQVEESNLPSNNALSNQQHHSPPYSNSIPIYNSLANIEDRFMTSELQQEDDVVVSIFTLINFQPEDTTRKFICTAKNSVGSTQENFTINIFLAHSSALNNWISFDKASTPLMIIFSIIILFILILLFSLLYYRYKTQSENNSSASSENKSHIENIIKNVKATFNTTNNMNKQKNDSINKLKKSELSNNSELINGQKMKISENNSAIYVSAYDNQKNSNASDMINKLPMNTVNNFSKYRNTTSNNNLDLSGITLLNDEVVPMSGGMMMNSNSVNVYNGMMNAPQEFTIDTTNTINVASSQYGSPYLQPAVNHLMPYSNSNFVDASSSGGYLHLSSNEQLLNSYNNYENMCTPFNQNIIDVQQQPYLLQNNYGNFINGNESVQQAPSISLNPAEEGIYYQNTLEKRTSPLIGNNLSHNLLSSNNNNNVLVNQEMSIYATLQQQNHHLQIQQPNNQHHVNILGQGSYNIAAQPTVVRYSPDEGYAEETANSNFTLEGTEV